MKKRSKYYLIGIPDHQGVIHVGGRIGAAGGPEAFRRLFFNLNGKVPLNDLLEDLGDVKNLNSDIQSNHRLASEMLERVHSNRIARSVVVGGGHDHGFSHLLGLKKSMKGKWKDPKLGCINIDAHLDVRKPAPLVTSGSPFFLALEAKVILPKDFIEFGIQSHCNSVELWKYAETKKIQIVPFQKLRNGRAVTSFKSAIQKLARTCDAIAVQLDLDALASVFSPGVSAPQSEGFTSSEIIEMMEICGKQEKVISIGIFELNPLHDRDSLSARLAATAVYHFICA